MAIPSLASSQPEANQSEDQNLKKVQDQTKHHPDRSAREKNRIRRLVKPLLIILGVFFIAFMGLLNYSATRRMKDIIPLPFPAEVKPLPSLGSTTNWKTYQSDTIELKYPQDWSLQETPLKLKGSMNRLIVSVVSFNPAVVGISYCEASLQEEPTQCERLTTRNASATIDWGDEGSIQANAIFNHKGVGLSVTLETNPDIPARLLLTSEDRGFFRTFLSTFRFLDGEQSTEGNRCGGEANIQCPQGHICLKQPNVPEAEGWCINTVCPDTQFVICIPENIDPETAPYCNPEYATWIQNSCPGVAVVY